MIPMGRLCGKRILFVCPRTFGYENSIVRELCALDAEVTFHSDRPVEHPWVKALIRLNPRLMWQYSDYHFSAWLHKEGPDYCDLLFVIKGEAISPTFLRQVRRRYPAAKMVLYLWDSIKNVKHTELKLELFDDIASFDPVDCEQYRFRYRPLFFMDTYLKTPPNSSGEGIFFIGTLNGDRPAVISRMLESNGAAVALDYWLLVRSQLELRIRTRVDPFIRKLDRKRLLARPMPAHEIAVRLANCVAALDIEHPNQTGLTMRTFEIIASGRKLITTNRRVVEHEFYDPRRILVIDRERPVVPAEFLREPAPALSSDFTERYSIRGWVCEVLASVIDPRDDHTGPFPHRTREAGRPY